MFNLIYFRCCFSRRNCRRISVSRQHGLHSKCLISNHIKHIIYSKISDVSNCLWNKNDLLISVVSLIWNNVAFSQQSSRNANMCYIFSDRYESNYRKKAINSTDRLERQEWELVIWWHELCHHGNVRQLPKKCENSKTVGMLQERK